MSITNVWRLLLAIAIFVTTAGNSAQAETDQWATWSGARGKVRLGGEQIRVSVTHLGLNRVLLLGGRGGIAVQSATAKELFARGGTLSATLYRGARQVSQARKDPKTIFASMGATNLTELRCTAQSNALILLVDHAQKVTLGNCLTLTAPN